MKSSNRDWMGSARTVVVASREVGFGLKTRVRLRTLATFAVIITMIIEG